jgi:hypothetical protein
MEKSFEALSSSLLSFTLILVRTTKVHLDVGRHQADQMVLP